MIYLLLTILLNVLLSVLFKLFERWRIDHLQAIIFNYWVCVITGSLFIGYLPVSARSLQAPWFPAALAMGAGFICIFNLMAYCTRTQGITTSTVANKLSLVIPAALSVGLYGDRLSWLQIAGIVLAFPAVYLVARPVQAAEPIAGVRHKNLFWTVLLFAGSGLLDTAMKHAELLLPADTDVQAIFSVHIFAVAAVIGLLVLIYLLVTGRRRFAWRNLAGGVLLGIPNFFSIYYFIRMLDSGFLSGAAMIPLNNTGILLVSTLASWLLFGEKLSSPRIAGICLAALVILLLTFS
jgi:drug/metabolite transporter (DMT)-like permease